MRTALLTLALLPLLACAQAWCPPGATWTYEYNLVLGGYYGVQRVEYVGDTLVGGYTAQRLDQTDVVAPFGSTNFQAYPSFSLFTRYDNEVVYIWDNTSAYDTLFWFGASPGDRWNVAGWPDGGNIAVTVLDTSTQVIDGVPLRRLVVEPFPGLPIDTVYERIGGLQLHINAFIWFVTDAPYEGLMCYRDQDIDFAASGITECGYTLSVPDERRARDVSAFPNPGTEHFTLDLSPGPHTITLFDATGRIVQQQRTTDARPVITTEALPAGVYLFSVRDEQGKVMGATWVKE
ncbi:MAG TPA: T9SS type A sorting domain-containing protein [Flavobacteriales bacterium]|nr:T9SS type A sorting domain-containing protein [Flavobacteriales bacterium]